MPKLRNSKYNNLGDAYPLNWWMQDNVLLKEDRLLQKDIYYWEITSNDLIDTTFSEYLTRTSIPYIFGNTDENKVELLIRELWIPGLNKCKNCSSVVYRRTMPTGNLKPKYLAICEAPGIGDGQKDNFDRTLVYGPTSKLIRESFVKANIYFNSHFTNLLKCSLPGNRPGTKEDFIKCFPILLKEISLLKPECLLLFGKRVSTFFNDMNYKEVLYRTFLHPTYYIYKSMTDKFLEDIKNGI